MSPQAPFLAPDRDNAFKEGRGKASGGTIYYSIPGIATRSSGSAVVTSGRDYYQPYLVATPIVVDQLACEVTATAAGNLRMGLYAADTDWQPVGAPLADSGDIADGNGVKTYTPTNPLVLPRGRYLGVLNNSGSATYRNVRADPPGLGIATAIGASPLNSTMRATRAYAAFPTPGTAWSTTDADIVGLLYNVFLRVSSP